MSSCDLLEYKQWDSDFFNQAIYNIKSSCINELKELTFDDVSNALIQIKIPSHALDLLDWAQQKGFVFIESEMSFKRHCMERESSLFELGMPEIALIDDITKIKELASHTFTYSRFRQPWFKTSDASTFYAEWSRKAVLQQYDDVCLKIENPVDKSIYGIVTAKRLNEQDACIGLICIAKPYQGKNIGSMLLAAIENWSFTQGIKNLYVATQGSNQRACLFYLRNQYQLHAINYWLYKRVP